MSDQDYRAPLAALVGRYGQTQSTDHVEATAILRGVLERNLPAARILAALDDAALTVDDRGVAGLLCQARAVVAREPSTSALTRTGDGWAIA